MNSFLTILSKQFPSINLTKNPFNTINLFEGPKIDFITYSFLSNIQNSINNNNSDNKFKILEKTILNNAFITKIKREYIIENFYIAQKNYFSFCKLALKYKIKKAKIFPMEMDLYLSTMLSDLPEQLVLQLYDNTSKTIYKYRLSDLITIINNALANAPDFFVEPLQIKNPYTNIPFTNSQLYTIYFKIQDSSLMMPILYQLFYCNNFDLQEFTKRNECIIRDHAIKSFLKGATIYQKHKNILKMLRTFNHLLPNIIIDHEFPKEKLVKAFENYLEYYLIIKYSLHPSLKYFAKEKLRLKLIKFNRLNSTFGRRIWKRAEKPASENTIISYPVNQINDNGVFVFNAQNSTNHFLTQSQSTYAFIDTVILEDTDRSRLTNAFSQFRRSRATRRRLAHIEYNPTRNIIDDIIADSDESDDEMPELIGTNHEQSDSDSYTPNTIVNQIMSILPNIRQNQN